MRIRVADSRGKRETMIKYPDIPTGQLIVFKADKCEAFMSGCEAAAQHPDGSIELRYTDWTFEKATWDKPPHLEDLVGKGWFMMVSTVQGQARKEMA